MYNLIKQKKNELRHDDNIHLFYDAGVGHSGRIIGFPGMAFGNGLKKNILQNYEHLSENYHQGDKIYLFGFSRGAFQVRVLSNILKSFELVKIDKKMNYEDKQAILNNIYMIHRCSY